MNELFKRRKNPGEEEAREGAVPSELETPMPSDASGELERLRAENQSLKLENEALRRTKDEELEFSGLFGIPMSDVPKQVASDAASQSIPLAAAYALYLAKENQRKSAAGRKSEQTAENSPGGVETAAPDISLTLEQIRRMPQSSVRRCYTQILKSLER